MSTKVRFEHAKQKGIFRDTRSGIYYLRDTIHDSELKAHWVDRSLKTDKLTEAVERATRIRNKIVRGDEVDVVRRTFDEAFDLVVKIQDGKAARTAEQSRDVIDTHLRPWFKANCPYLTGRTARYPDGFERQFEEIWSDYGAEAAKWKLPSYITDPKKQEAWLKAHTARRKLEHDRRYLVMTLIRANKRGWIEKEFEKTDFNLNEVTEPIGRALEDEEVERLLKASAPYPKLRLQILLALLMGMRISEILHLAKAEVNLKRLEIDLNAKRVKTRKRRQVEIPIADDVLPLLQSAYHESEGLYIFPATFHHVPGQPIDWNQPQDDNSYVWRKVKAAAGVECRFHDLRHTAITNMVVRGMPETSIRQICGVEEDTMRRIYAHLKKELKTQFRGLFRGKFVE